jgi:tetratricopeptide (TPR) repeat protein
MMCALLLSRFTFDILRVNMVNARSFRAILYALVLLLGLGLTGCSVFSTIGGWISQGYDNTVSYFNAYYNAKTLFDEAEAEVLAARSAMKPKSTNNAVPQSTYPGSSGFADGRGFPSQQGMQSSPGFPSQTGFPNAQGYQSNQPQPAYQSPLPQQASSSAKQKFASVIDKCSNILSFYPKSAVVDDALFLIGKSYFYQDEFVRAERKFSELIVQDPNGPLALEAQLWLLKTLQRLLRYEDALRVGNELVDIATKAEKNETAGEALEILGEVSVSQKKTDAAIEFYTKAVAVADNGPVRATAQSKIGDIYMASDQFDKAATAYGEVPRYSPDAYGHYMSQIQAAIAHRRVGQFDTAIEILRKLESDYRFMDFWGTIRSELAGTFAANHKFDEAVDLYRMVDTTNARTEEGARAAFELGRLLQVQMGNYPDAKVAFSHATVGGPQDLTREAQRRTTALDKYLRLADQFVKLDSIYFIIDIDSLWMKVDSSSVLARKEKSEVAIQGSRKDSVDAFGESVLPRRTPAATPSAATTLAVAPAAATALAVTPPVTDTSSSKEAMETADDKPGTLPMILMKPRKDTLVSSLSNTAYEIGDLFYTDLDVPDSTFFWLNQARKLGLDSVKSVRTLFVLAEVARANPEKKYGDEKDFYRQIVDKYPKSSYAEQARIALGYPPTPRKVDPAVAMFAVAESLMYAGRYQGAIDSLRRIATDFSESLTAPKSRYTMGWIYENNLANPDSALAQYKFLVAKYGSTKYGEAAVRRIPPVPPDTTKKPAVVPQKPPVPDSTAKGKAPGQRKFQADTTLNVPQKSPVPLDSLFRKDDLDERPLRRTATGDSVSSHKVK